MVPDVIFEPPALPGLPSVQRPDLNGVAIDGLSSWQHRVSLASKGWMTEFQLKEGLGYQGWSVSLHAKHHHWHGGLSDVHIGVWEPWPKGITPWDDVEGSIEVIRRQFLKLHCRCDETWQACTDFVPYGYRRNGVWEEDTIASRYYRKFPEGVVRPERTQVTERLPGWPGQIDFRDFLAIDTGGDEWVRAIIALSRQASEAQASFFWSDSLDPFSGTHHAYENREWQLRQKGLMHRIGDRRIRGMDTLRLLESSTRNLTSTGAHGLAVLTSSLLEQVIGMANTPAAEALLGIQDVESVGPRVSP